MIRPGVHEEKKQPINKRIMKTLKNTIMTAIAAGLAMTAYSCSEEKSVQDEPESGAIRFGAAISRPTRTAPTTTSTIKNFTVYAFTDGKPYMENVKVTRSNGTWTYSTRSAQVKCVCGNNSTIGSAVQGARYFKYLYRMYNSGNAASHRTGGKMGRTLPCSRKILLLCIAPHFQSRYKGVI